MRSPSGVLQWSGRPDNRWRTRIAADCVGVVEGCVVVEKSLLRTLPFDEVGVAVAMIKL